MDLAIHLERSGEEINKFRTSPDELVDFFDTHDLGEYWDEMPEAHFEVELKERTHLFALDAGLADELTKVAQSRHIPSEVLINAWLKERIHEQI